MENTCTHTVCTHIECNTQYMAGQMYTVYLFKGYDKTNCISMTQLLQEITIKEDMETSCSTTVVKRYPFSMETYGKWSHYDCKH